MIPLTPNFTHGIPSYPKFLGARLGVRSSDPRRRERRAVGAFIAFRPLEVGRRRKRGKTMALLVGRHLCKIDKKGRVSVPKPFRAPFESAEFRGVYAFPLFKYAALLACDEEQMKRLLGDIDALEMFSDDQDDLAAVIMNNAETLTFDPEGRIVLTPAFMDHTGIGGQVLFVGRGSRFEMWDPSTFEMHNAAAFERARARGVTLPRRSPSSEVSS